MTDMDMNTTPENVEEDDETTTPVDAPVDGDDEEGDEATPATGEEATTDAE